MSRSIWKGPFSSLIKKPTYTKQSTKSGTNTHFSQSNQQNVWCRDSMILPQDIGKEFKIYNGKSWYLRRILESMVGHKFGEFSPTKKRVIHKSNKKKQISKKK